MSEDTYEQCCQLVIRLGVWRKGAATSEDRALRTARIQHAMGALRLYAVPSTRLKDARDALHALITEVGA